VQPVRGRDPLVRADVLKQLEADPRAVHHGGGHGVVERDNGVVAGLHQHLVQRQDLRPVGFRGRGRLVVQGGDRRLDLIRAGRPAP